MRAVQVIALARIGFDVVKLHRRRIRGRPVLWQRPAAGASAKDQLPRALSDRKLAVIGVHDDRIAHGLVGLPPEQRKNVKAVLSGIIGQRVAKYCGAGAQQICQTYNLAARRAGGNFAGPAGNEGDVMPAVPGMATRMIRGQMPLSQDIPQNLPAAEK